MADFIRLGGRSINLNAVSRVIELSSGAMRVIYLDNDDTDFGGEEAAALRWWQEQQPDLLEQHRAAVAEGGAIARLLDAATQAGREAAQQWLALTDPAIVALVDPAAGLTPSAGPACSAWEKLGRRQALDLGWPRWDLDTADTLSWRWREAYVAGFSEARQGATTYAELTP